MEPGVPSKDATASNVGSSDEAGTLNGTNDEAGADEEERGSPGGMADDDA